METSCVVSESTRLDGTRTGLEQDFSALGGGDVQACMTEREKGTGKGRGEMNWVGGVERLKMRVGEGDREVGKSRSR